MCNGDNDAIIPHSCNAGTPFSSSTIECLKREIFEAEHQRHHLPHGALIDGTIHPACAWRLYGEGDIRGLNRTISLTKHTNTFLP
jgi:hypothetical protein